MERVLGPLCQALRACLQSIIREPSGIRDEEDLQRHARFLTEGLQAVIDQHVPMKEDQLGFQLLVVQGAGTNSPRATSSPTEVEPDQGSS